MYERMIYIFSNGANYKTITNTKAEIITDNIYRYAVVVQADYLAVKEAIVFKNSSNELYQEIFAR